MTKLATFLDGGLWFSRLDQFGDKLEGTLPQVNLGLLRKLLPADASIYDKHLRHWKRLGGEYQVRVATQAYERAALCSYASCWHMSKRGPSQYAWDIFGDEGDGVALKTTPAAVQQAIASVSDGPGPVYFSEIQYIDHAKTKIPEANTLPAAFAVRSDYEREREARILIYTESGSIERLVNKSGPYGPAVRRPFSALTNKQEMVGGQQSGKAIVVAINPSQLIHEIVFGPRVTESNRKEVIELVRCHGLSIKTRQVRTSK